MGHTVCINCGQVLEENAIVAEVQFAEKSSGAAVAEGFAISKDSSRAKAFGKFNSQVSRDRIIENGNKRIAQIAAQIKMSQRQIEAAQRYFNLSVSHGFNKGRRGNPICAACLYIVCRQDKTSHMLIDFADVLQTNVYVLGATFLRLVQILHLQLPLVDPALYVARFASRLDFGDQTQKVIANSLRLVQRMNRDWIQIGRRPAGICAAALFISARMNGFDRSYREIILVVKICEATLKKRLDEFKQTPSANLSVSDFSNIWLEQDADPPSFNPKKQQLDSDDESLQEEIKDYLADPATLDSISTFTNSQEISSSLLESDPDLTILDNDPEIQHAILDEKEHEFKKYIWEDEFGEYMMQLQEKHKKKPVEPSKKKKRRIEKFTGKDVAESVGNLLESKPALSKKINYEMLESMFE
jgi:transcription factor IIIB subunit 2